MDNNPAKSHSNNNQGYSQLSQDIKQLHLKSFFDRSLSKEDQLFFDALISDYINRGRIYNSRMSKNVQWEIIIHQTGTLGQFVKSGQNVKDRVEIYNTGWVRSDILYNMETKD